MSKIVSDTSSRVSLNSYPVSRKIEEKIQEKPLLLAHVTERACHVAAFARPSELAAVYVVLLVAGIAVLRQLNLGDILRDMAGVALKAAMLPRQREVRLGVVIETPERPGIGIVALRAVRPKASLVMRVAVA